MGMKHKYEIKKDGKVIVSYDDERCHYSVETLRNMRQNGYKLYIDGKMWKDEKTKRKG